MDILLDAESLLRRWQQHPGERQELSALLDELTTLGEGAHLADLHPVDEPLRSLARPLWRGGRKQPGGQ